MVDQRSAKLPIRADALTHGDRRGDPLRLASRGRVVPQVSLGDDARCGRSIAIEIPLTPSLSPRLAQLQRPGPTRALHIAEGVCPLCTGAVRAPAGGRTIPAAARKQSLTLHQR